MAAARSSLRRLAAESLRAAGPAGVDFGGSRQLCIAAASGASLLHRGSDLSGPSFSGRQLEHPVKALAGFAAYQQVRSASWGSWGSWGSGGGAKAPPAVPVQAVPAEEAQAGAATAAEQALQAATQAVDAAAAVTASGGSEIAAIADQSWYPILGLQYLIENIHLTLGVPWCEHGGGRTAVRESQSVAGCKSAQWDAAGKVCVAALTTDFSLFPRSEISL